MTMDEPDRADLLEALAYQRSSVLGIVAGMSEDHWHRSVVPSGWTPAGMVAHLGGAERHWTSGVILANDQGHPFDSDFDDDEEYDPMAPFVIAWPSSKVLTYYTDMCRNTDEMLAVTPLNSAPEGFHGSPEGEQPRTVRAIVLHLIEETAAHSGHLEIGRELLDGQTRRGGR